MEYEGKNIKPIKKGEDFADKWHFYLIVWGNDLLL